ncbi:MAG: DSD1 family PLP-dependent enzyme [Rhodospirillales bacterium]|nr:DSD1 family PLP-dependent enzyme [Rhodospirillales bacterium]
MTTRPPAQVGQAIDAIDTPALLIDLDAFERNLKRMADHAAKAGVRLRPHAKTHKCAVIARRQMALGAVGVCCQTVGEAEAMVFGGVTDVLVSNEIVEPSKIARLAGLARQADIATCVDSSATIEALGAAARAAGAQLRVLVEVEVGGNRCGAEPGRPTLELARTIAATPGLVFGGLHAYHGRAQHIRSFAERKGEADSAVAKAKATKELLEANGLPCELVTGAGTGTYRFEPMSGVYNELQAGSYVFMDADYGRNLNDDGALFADFENSLFVLATVISTPTGDRAVVNAGLKASSVDSGMPTVADFSDVTYVGASDEHGRLDLSKTNRRLRVGERIKLIPGHCDPTVNLYDWFVCLRGDRIESLWPIAGRGAI